MGYDEQISAMESPTNMVKTPARNQPKVMVTVPPNRRPVLYSVVMPVRTDMMEKEKAKFDKTLTFPPAEKRQ